MANEQALKFLHMNALNILSCGHIYKVSGLKWQ